MYRQRSKNKKISLEERVITGFGEMKSNFKELKSDIKNLNTKMTETNEILKDIRYILQSQKNQEINNQNIMKDRNVNVEVKFTSIKTHTKLETSHSNQGTKNIYDDIKDTFHKNRISINNIDNNRKNKDFQNNGKEKEPNSLKDIDNIKQKKDFLINNIDNNRKKQRFSKL